MRGCSSGARAGRARRGRGPGRAAQVPSASSHRPCYLFRDSDCTRFPDKVASSFAEGGKGRVSVNTRPLPLHTPPHTPEGRGTSEHTLGNGLSWQRGKRPRRIPAEALSTNVLAKFGWLPPTQSPQHTSYWQRETSYPTQRQNLIITASVVEAETSNQQQYMKSSLTWALQSKSREVGQWATCGVVTTLGQLISRPRPQFPHDLVRRQDTRS